MAVSMSQTLAVIAFIPKERRTTGGFPRTTAPAWARS